MPHEYRPPKYRQKKRKPEHKKTERKEKPKSLGLEVTRKDSIRAKLMKQLYWCPVCNIPLLAKTCACKTESIKIDLQQPYDVRPALKGDYELIRNLIQERFGEKVTLPNILVLNKAGGMDRNDLIIANGVRFAWLSFDQSRRRFSLDIEAEALPWLIGKADRGIVRLEDAAVSVPEGRLGGKKIAVKPQAIEDGVVIVRYKSKYGTGILKGESLKIKELGAVEPAKQLPNPTWNDAVAKNAFHLKNMERTAVREIRQNLSLKPTINCSFSGGKDSTAVWHIAQKAGVEKAFFIDTGLEFPETIEFVKAQNVEFISKAGNFWQAVEKAGPPAKDHRWCCKLLKLNPLKVHLNETGECLTVQGNRWYESWNRAELEAVTQNPNNPLQLNISPIRSWRALDVFFYLWLKEVPYNPLYEMGYERIGCYLCPAMLEAEQENMHKTHPEMAKRWDDFLNRWAADRGLPEEFISWGLWRWKEFPPKMKELVREKGLDLTEKPVKRSTPASVAHLMPEHQRENLVDDTVPEVPAIKEIDVEKVRADFPMIGDIIYMDNGATSFSPNQVISAVSEFDQNFRANVGRGIHRLSKIATQKYWHAHQKVAKFINGEEGTVVFTKNSTEALNIVAKGFPFNEGDTVVLTQLEHHSNILPWRALKGVNIRIVKIKDDFTLDMDELKRILEEDKTVRLVTVTHASNVTGTVNPVEEIGKLCRKAGVSFCIDGAQAVPHMKVDVEKICADYYIFSGHKMFGPTGTGVLWMREENLEPLILGGGMVESVSDDSYVPAKGYAKYESGTPNISGGIGLAAAVDYLEALGMDAVHAREKKLTDLLIEGLEKIEGVELFACKDANSRVGAVSFNVPGVHPHELSAWLDEEHGIAVRSGMHCAEPLMRRLGASNGTVRASLSFYNTESEVNTLVSVIRELLV
ncbi:MAG: aminotransferase class V-fold PLP-dependent enzyme [Methanocorpusculum sp.]|nr:aminotransferase class V-fold PLP-dependent enzyme [Methanocorpusculum sp.]